jgi:hypothetical protein
MIALTSATGKLGSAVLNAIFDNNFIDGKELVVCVGATPFSRTIYPLTSQSDIFRPFCLHV